MTRPARSAAFTSDDVADGLPVFAPTRARVDALLGALGKPGDEVIGTVPPANAVLTWEVAAANAALTDCSPGQLWIVVEILKTILLPEFNLLSIQATTHPAGPVVLVSGPASRKVQIHGGSGCMGPGFAANARIGRAVRLILMNVGGARPGGLDMATFGGPAKFAMVFTDQEVVHPNGNRWGTFAEDFTSNSEDSVVVAIGGEGPVNVNDHYATSANGILKMVSHSISIVGSNHAHNPDSTPMAVLGPEHAQLVVGEGLTRQEAAVFIARNARIPLAKWSPEAREGRIRKRHPKLYGQAEPWEEIAILQAQDLFLSVAGGPGKHSVVIPAFGRSFGIRKIDPIPKMASE